MIPARRIAPHCLWLLTITLVAGCVRTAPPAPVVAREAGTRTAAPAMESRASAGAAPAPIPHPDHVTVERGETLYSLSRRYGVPVRSLIEANALTPPYALNAGRRLFVPQVRQHVVQPGDTLYSISRLYGVDTSTLARTNGLRPPYVVRVGQSLELPASVEVAGARRAAPVIQATAPAASLAAPAIPVPPPVLAPVIADATPPPSSSASPPPSYRPSVPPPEEAKPVAAAPKSAPEPAKPAPTPEPPAVTAPPPAQLAALPPPPPPSSPAGAGPRSFIWPVHGRILAGYGTGQGGTHNDGINIAAPAGTPVLAADDGVVAYAGNELRGYGNLVLIKHARGWMTAYAHNAALLVKRGQPVKRGQTIARVGATGAVGEPQLHFEIRHGTRALDPDDYLPPLTATAAKD
jgi:murein DD-endopeptidase MepM/ murein hydrolase activator NlpD